MVENVMTTVVPRFIKAFAGKQFASQTEEFGRILFLFTNSASDDRHNCGHLSQTNTNMAIVSKIIEQIQFRN